MRVHIAAASGVVEGSFSLLPLAVKNRRKNRVKNWQCLIITKRYHGDDYDRSSNIDGLTRTFNPNKYFPIVQSGFHLLHTLRFIK